MKKFVFLLIFLLCSIPIVANAANWKEFTTKAYLDFDTWEYKNGYINIWIKMLNDGHKKPINGQQVWYDIQKLNIDCNYRRLKVITSTTYGLKRQVLDSYDFGYYGSWSEIVPESVGESLYNYVCK